MGGASFGTASIFIKESQLTPAAITFLRFAVAGFILSKGRFVHELKLKEYLVLGGLLSLHMFTFVEGVYHTTIIDATVLVSTSPFFVVILSFLGKYGTTRRDLIAVIIGFLGVVLINFPLNEGDILGNLISVFSAFTIALYTLKLSKIAVRDPLGNTAWIYLTSALFSFPFFLLEGIGRIDLVSILSLIGLIFLPTLIGHTSIVVASGKVKPQHIETIGLLEPVVATALSIQLFREVPTPLELLGSTLIISSIIVVIRSEE